MQAGIYWGKLQVKGYATESSNGNGQIEARFNVEQMANGADWTPIQPVERTVYISLTDAAWPYSTPKLAKLGFNGDFDNPVFAGDAVTTGLQLECRSETYNDKAREKWEIVGVDRPEPKPLSKDKALQLAGRWKAQQGGQKLPF